jgi:hypothetical protein
MLLPSLRPFVADAPKKIFDGFASWARGDYDPEFQRKKKNKK